MLQQLRAIDSSMLTDVVRQDQCSPDFQIIDWAVRSLSDRGNEAEGLFYFSGHGRNEQNTRPWSVVLKVLKDAGDAIEPSNYFYWKRELLVNQSKLLELLPDPVRSPRCYGTREYEGGAWIWMELVNGDTTGRWGLKQYTFAAHQLGQFNGAYLTGTSLPDYPWLSRDSHMPRASPEVILEHPHVQKALSAQARARVMQLWTDLRNFMDVRSRLPQVFSHVDANRRNLVIRSQAKGAAPHEYRRSQHGWDELVVMDWAKCGIGPLGGDLYSLVGMSGFVFEWEPAALAELEAIASRAYLAGLQLAGWRGDPTLVRLGYISLTSTVFGLWAPFVIAHLASEEGRAWAQRFIGRTPEEFSEGMVALCEFALDRADEARQLADCLKLA